MPKMKVFMIDTTHAVLPLAWRDALGFARHRIQGDLLLIAPTKAVLTEMLRDRGESQPESLVRQARVGWLSTPWEKVVDTGLVDPTVPGVYASERAAKGNPIGEILPGGEVRILGHFRYDGVYGGRGLWVEAAT